MAEAIKLSTWPLLTAAQVRAWDAYSIAHEPITSIDLMERASVAFAKQLADDFPDPDQRVLVVCGPGNNGGDGLAVARLLHQCYFKNVTIWLCFNNKTPSSDAVQNLQRVQQIPGVEIHDIGSEFPSVAKDSLVVDALFGTGLNRPLEGLEEALINYLNSLSVVRLSIDIPSGMEVEGKPNGIVFQAGVTYTFQSLKKGFLLNGSGLYAGKWKVLDIGLTPAYLDHSDYQKAVYGIQIPARQRFTHKGSYGHALVIAGSRGKIGAAVLATRAALRSGAGLVTVRVPGCGYEILQMAAPEAMVDTDDCTEYLLNPMQVEGYKAIGIGPGIGLCDGTANMLADLLKRVKGIPLVLDADALNLIATHPAMWMDIPRNTVLTPHPREFDRMFGTSANAFERSHLAVKVAKERGIYIVLKDAYTQIACPNGTVYYSTSGNPGMATGGSGDVLTGLLTGMIAQYGFYEEVIAAAVWLHGRAGDKATQQRSASGMIAGDLIEQIGNVYLECMDVNC